jgi:hypothetical protein
MRPAIKEITRSARDIFRSRSGIENIFFIPPTLPAGEAEKIGLS